MFDLEKIKACLSGGNGPELLQEAFTHRSYAVEHGLAYDNQRLEFLGDAVIETILSEHLFKLYPGSPEGVLTQMRSALVCESALARLARRFDLGMQDALPRRTQIFRRVVGAGRECQFDGFSCENRCL